MSAEVVNIHSHIMFQTPKPPPLSSKERWIHCLNTCTDPQKLHSEVDHQKLLHLADLHPMTNSTGYNFNLALSNHNQPRYKSDQKDKLQVKKLELSKLPGASASPSQLHTLSNQQGWKRIMHDIFLRIQFFSQFSMWFVFRHV